MRIESAVTSISWIPSEAIRGTWKVPFAMGISHYDDAPPETIDDLEELQSADRFRFANELRAWIEVDDGHVTRWGYSGGGRIGATTLRVARRAATFAAVPLPDRQAAPVVTGDTVRFEQTAGGRTGIPAPRHVRRPPFVQFSAPIAWTTLALTISADGAGSHAVVGASTFPRHWIYDAEGRLVRKSGLINFDNWQRRAFGRHTPWGDVDSPALMTEVESALERQLAAEIMSGDSKPRITRVAAGKPVVAQGDHGSDVFVLLDGVAGIEVDGTALADVGPGAVLGERSALGDDTRTATVRAVTPCKVAWIAAERLDSAALHRLAGGHQREAG